VRLGDPSFGAPSLQKLFPGRPDGPMALPDLPDRPTRTPEANHLLRELQQSDVTGARRRDIGKRLAEIEDPRRGVGVWSGVPDIEWVFVSPGGNVDIEGSRKSVSPFYLARYDVTYGLYEAFVKASDGFANPQWWQGQPSGRDLRNQANRQLNAPRENVTWYQAGAFTRWLNARLRAQSASVSAGSVRVNGLVWEVRLPTEWEWQWAAQGVLSSVPFRGEAGRKDAQTPISPTYVERPPWVCTQEDRRRAAFWTCRGTWGVVSEQDQPSLRYDSGCKQ